MTDSHSTGIPLRDDPTSVKYLLRLAGPMIISNTSFTIMQFVDRFMVSRLGKEELAAVLPAGLLAFVPGSFAIGVVTAINACVSQSIGTDRPRDAGRYGWQGLLMGMIYFAACVAVFVPAARPIFQAMGHEPAVVEMEVTYFRILMLGQGAAIIHWCLAQFFMAVHRPKITMYSAFAGQIVNVLANYTLIFGMFGFPAMGIAGAAWGTVLGSLVSAGLMFSSFVGRGIDSRFNSRQLRVEPEKMWHIARIGAPAGFAMVANVAMWGVLLFWLVGPFGTAALAATSAVLSCTNVSVMPVVGISGALTAAVGRSIGMQRHDLARIQTSISLKIGMIYMGIAGLIFLLFRYPIMRFWSVDNNPEVIAIGGSILILAAIFQVFDAATIVYTGALRAAGDTMWLVMVTLVAGVLILGVGGYTVVHLRPQLGAVGPWIAATAYIMVVGTANRWRFKSNKWTAIDIFRSKQIMPLPLENEGKP